MARYRKKPVVIDAVRNDGTWPTVMAWLVAIDAASTVSSGMAQNPDGTLSIHTLEGTMVADIGDYLIRGVKGELYPCKPDIFEATYEPVDA